MNLHDLPENLPAPQDDGACDHLPGLRLPSVVLPATNGTQVEMSALTGKTVLYVYR